MKPELNSESSILLRVLWVEKGSKALCDPVLPNSIDSILSRHCPVKFARQCSFTFYLQSAHQVSMEVKVDRLHDKDTV